MFAWVVCLEIAPEMTPLNRMNYNAAFIQFGGFQFSQFTCKIALRNTFVTKILTTRERISNTGTGQFS